MEWRLMTGQEFREARKAMGLKGTEMARMMCVSYRTLQGWEFGKRSISPWVVRLRNERQP